MRFTRAESHAIAEDMARLQSENVKMRDALEEIANPIAAIQARAKRDGLQVDGHMAVVIANDPYYLKEIAKKALAHSRPKCGGVE